MNTQPDLSRLMQGVIPYLAISGAQDAIDFYTRAFGAVQHGESAKAEDGRIMNAGLEINGGILMLMDTFPEHGMAAAGPAALHGVTMQIVTREGDLWWNRAVGAGCEVIQPLKLEFWGDRYGRLRDPFGIDWAINEPGAGK
jgi:PhnB protein